MNYYEHHLGDWAASTGHLSWDEDMAYTRLLRAYYHAERAIPEGQQYRLAKASTPAQRRAVDAVLAEFFTLVEGSYHQKRADAEIARYADKQRKAKASANARWAKSEGNANASPNAMRTHSEGNAHHTPDTRHQTPPSVSTHTATSTEAARVAPTQAGLICRAMKAEGIADVNPGNADLLALIAAGADEVEFVGAARTAASRSKGFAYAIGTLKRQREDAARAAQTMPTGAMPASKQQARENRNAQVAASLAQRYTTEEHHASE